MPSSERRARRRAVPALIVSALGLMVSSCTFPSSGGGSSADATAPPAASKPPAGVVDPAKDARYQAYYSQRVDWSGCNDGFSCARFKVPLDWAKPAGKAIEIAAVRLPARGRKIGSLVINPGGPGASGIQYARAANQVFGQAILRSYDVVGFDPRGIGESDPVSCLSDAQLDTYTAIDATPDDQAEIDASVASVKNFAAACQRNTGALLGHVDTLSAARDMDVLRAVLGDDRLTYHGASYGTYLGAWYAQTFPWRVGRMTLDGAVDPTLTSKEYVAGQAEGFSRALRAYVQDCQQQSDCPLRGSLDEGLTQIGTLVDRADGSPLRTDDPKRPLTQALMVTGIAQALYADQLWPALTIALTRAMAGEGGALLQLADTYLERDAKGRYGQTIDANPSIFCLDVPETRTPAQISADADEVARQYPPLGGTIGWGALSCAEWPLKAVLPRKPLTAPGAAPILVLGTVSDPATPYEWAQALASQLSSGRLLTWEGTEHTAYHKGSTCIDAKVESYLLTGALPAAGTRCT